MSAIFGKLNFDHQPINPMELSAMEKALNHWAADKSTLWFNGNIGFGHLMLYNTPESLYEQQPFYNNESKLVITADARIDNREELFSKLSIPKNDVQHVPDSIVILKAYQKYGADCVKHLAGDFAFAIWHEAEQTLFCARDQMGVKPFFYCKNEHFFAFASEKKGLLALGGPITEVSQDYLLNIAGGINPPDIGNTLYRHILRLKPAHTLLLDCARVVFNKYWELDIYREIYYKNKADYLESFLDKFKSAVNCRLRSVYLPGTELSGGLDSSGITCIAASLLHAKNKEIASFSLAGTKETALYYGYEERDNELIEAVHRFARVDHPEIIRNSGYANWLDEIDFILSVFDGPEHSTTLWSFPLKKKAGQAGVRALLSGFGGDELVSNFSNNYYLDELAKSHFYSYFKIALQEIHFKTAIKELISFKTAKWLAPALLKSRKQKAEAEYISSPKNFLRGPFVNKLLTHVKGDRFYPLNFKDQQKQHFNSPHSYLRYEAETLAGYPCRVETRFPMIDVPLMEYVISLPANQKMAPGYDRFLFRNAMKGLMPGLLLNETSYTGFSSPYVFFEWLQTQHQKLEWLNKLQEAAQIPEYLNLEKIKKGYIFTKQTNTDQVYLAKRKQIETILKFLTPHIKT